MLRQWLQKLPVWACECEVKYEAKHIAPHVMMMGRIIKTYGAMRQKHLLRPTDFRLISVFT